MAEQRPYSMADPRDPENPRRHVMHLLTLPRGPVDLASPNAVDNISRIACGRKVRRFTRDPDRVTCPQCKDYIRTLRPESLAAYKAVAR